MTTPLLEFYKKMMETYDNISQVQYSSKLKNTNKNNLKHFFNTMKKIRDFENPEENIKEKIHALAELNRIVSDNKTITSDKTKQMKNLITNLSKPN